MPVEQCSVFAFADPEFRSWAGDHGFFTAWEKCAKLLCGNPSGNSDAPGGFAPAAVASPDCDNGVWAGQFWM